jgi:hypothetical protein
VDLFKLQIARQYIIPSSLRLVPAFLQLRGAVGGLIILSGLSMDSISLYVHMKMCVLSCSLKPTWPFRVGTCGEDF